MERTNLPAHSLLKLLIAIVLLATAGCTSLFFQPTHTRYPYLELDRLIATTKTLTSKDGTPLKAWVFDSTANIKQYGKQPVIPKKGVALQFHGNAENMTSHYRFMIWLLFEGWDVITFDYRGYGDSEGSPSKLSGVKEDGIAALQFAEALASEIGKPLVVFGQSLGGNIAVAALSEYQPPSLSLLILDSSFYSFRSIAKEKLGSVWFLWPLQPLGYALVSNALGAGPILESDKTRAAFKNMRALFLHSTNDPVVSYRQGDLLYESYPGPKLRMTTDALGHVNALADDRIRRRTAQVMESPAKEFPSNP